MKKIKINTSNSEYDILLGNNILSNLNNYLQNYDQILILSNEDIGNLYFDKLKSHINSFNNLHFFTIPEGENYKNINSVMSIYDYMIDNNFSRKSVIISLGGGVICDIGGFTAATYMRGIDFIQIPTSLLSQVDASIGGKTAIDHSKGKNLIGAFKQPKLVLIDTDFLKTLPKEQFSSGMGEVIKYSLIIYSNDKSYFNFLRNNKEDILNLKINTVTDMIEKACLIKKYFVENDEFENGDRALLNLGHTYGHALEKLFDFKNITHGEAISKGIIFELELSKKIYSIDSTFISQIIDLFLDYNINPYPIYYEDDILIDTLKKDKKNSFGNITFIVFDKELKTLKKNVESKDIKEINNMFKNRFIKGIIDIGTNSCRLFIAQILKKDNQLFIEKELLKLVNIVKLGEDVNKNKFLKEEAIFRTLDCLKNYKNICQNMGVSKLIAFATSATRDATNKNVFLDKVKNLGIDIKCISGQTEATLNFKGNTLVFSDNILVVDIGGGSTEFTLGNKNHIEFIKSFNVGAVRVTELFFKNDNYSTQNIDNCIKWIEDILQPIKTLSNKNFKLVGVAGTATTQISVAKKLLNYDSKIVHLSSITRDDIENNLKLFLSMDLQNRKNITGLEEKRADVIIAGTVILQTIMKILNCNKLIVSESDNLNGAMITEEINND